MEARDALDSQNCAKRRLEDLLDVKWQTMRWFLQALYGHVNNTHDGTEGMSIHQLGGCIDAELKAMHVSRGSHYWGPDEQPKSASLMTIAILKAEQSLTAAAKHHVALRHILRRAEDDVKKALAGEPWRESDNTEEMLAEFRKANEGKAPVRPGPVKEEHKATKAEPCEAAKSLDTGKEDWECDDDQHLPNYTGAIVDDCAPW